MRNIFYFTDVHGQLDLFQTMRDWCYKQDPECTIIYGGDACDRGLYGYDIMTTILEDPQIIYIRGNHEDMFIHAAREIVHEYPQIMNTMVPNDLAEDIIDDCSFCFWVYNCIRNGGKVTLKAWLVNGTNMDFINQLDNNTCLTVEADNGMCFNHAGGSYEVFTRVNDAEYNNEFADKDDIEHTLWDRDHLYSIWPNDKINIFGHTPVVYLNASVYGENKSNDKTHPCAYKIHGEAGLKIDMDTAMTFTGRGYVLNCTTGIVTGFWDHDFNKHENKRPVEQEFETYKII